MSRKMQDKLMVLGLLLIALVLVGVLAGVVVPAVQELMGVAWHVVMTTPVDGPELPVVDRGGW